MNRVPLTDLIVNGLRIAAIAMLQDFQMPSAYRNVA